MTSSQTITRGRIRIEPSPKRVRVQLGGVTVADSGRAVLVWEKPYYPTYYFPVDDVRTDLLASTAASPIPRAAATARSTP